MSFIIILPCNCVARSICTLLALFVFLCKLFSSKQRINTITRWTHNSSPLLGKFTPYRTKEWKQQVSFSICLFKLVSVTHTLFHKSRLKAKKITILTYLVLDCFFGGAGGVMTDQKLICQCFHVPALNPFQDHRWSRSHYKAVTIQSEVTPWTGSHSSVKCMGHQRVIGLSKYIDIHTRIKWVLITLKK